MRLALVPISLQPGKRHDNALVMARWVERLHNRVDLIAFPKIPFDALPIPAAQEPDDVADQTDLVRGFALKRAAYVAAGFHHSRPTGQRNLLALADRTGQTLTQSQAIRGSREDAIPPMPLLLTSLVAGARIAVTHAGNALDVGLAEMAQAAHPQAILVLMALQGAQDEHRRIAAHNPPRALAALRQSMTDLARRCNAPLFAVNAIAPDTEEGCGPCGGVFAIDASGRFIHDQRLYDEAPYEAEILPDR